MNSEIHWALGIVHKRKIMEINKTLKSILEAKRVSVNINFQHDRLQRCNILISSIDSFHQASVQISAHK